MWWLELLAAYVAANVILLGALWIGAVREDRRIRNANIKKQVMG